MCSLPTAFARETASSSSRLSATRPDDPTRLVHSCPSARPRRQDADLLASRPGAYPESVRGATVMFSIATAVGVVSVAVSVASTPGLAIFDPTGAVKTEVTLGEVVRSSAQASPGANGTATLSFGFTRKGIVAFDSLTRSLALRGARLHVVQHLQLAVSDVFRSAQTATGLPVFRDGLDGSPDCCTGPAHGTTTGTPRTCDRPPAYAGQRVRASSPPNSGRIRTVRKTVARFRGFGPQPSHSIPPCARW